MPIFDIGLFHNQCLMPCQEVYDVGQARKMLAEMGVNVSFLKHCNLSDEQVIELACFILALIVEYEKEHRYHHREQQH